MKIIISLTAVLIFTNFVCGQNDDKPVKETIIKVGDGCEGCDAVYDSPIPLEELSSVDTLPDFNTAQIKLEISGVIYQSDGITPARELYYTSITPIKTGIIQKREMKADDTATLEGGLRQMIKVNINFILSDLLRIPMPHSRRIFTQQLKSPEKLHTG